MSVLFYLVHVICLIGIVLFLIVICLCPIRVVLYEYFSVVGRIVFFSNLVLVWLFMILVSDLFCFCPSLSYGVGIPVDQSYCYSYL